MARYRIVCTVQEPYKHPPKNAHIVAVGTGDDPDKADKRWTVDQVWEAMDRGDSFFTKGRSSGKEAGVEKWECGICNLKTLRSKPDAVTDNNLDSLRICRQFS